MIEVIYTKIEKKIRPCFFLLISMFISVDSYPQAEFRRIVIGVVENYPTVVAAKNQVNAAQADLNSVRWNYYPTPSITHERADQKVAGVLNQTNTYYRLQQPLWTAGRLTAQNEKALGQYQFAENALAEQKLSAALRWLQLWAEFQSAALKVNAYQDSERKHKEYVLQIERRAQEGYSALSDVQLSLSRLSSVQSDLRQYQFNQRQASIKLEQMLKNTLPQKNWKDIDDGWPRNSMAFRHWSPVMAQDLLADITDKHPSIQKAMAAVQSAQADVALAQSRNMPEVYLRGEIRRGDVSGTDRTVYMGLSSSFGAGLSNFSAIAAAQAKVEASQNELEGRRMDVSEIIQSDLQVFQSQSERVTQLEKTFENNRKYLESSERQFLAGRRTWQEIMNIAREEAQILTQIADAKAQTWLSHQRLQIFSQGLDDYLAFHASSPIVRDSQNDYK